MSINLQRIITVKGQPGLFHLTSYNPKGFFLQPFEGGAIRFFSNEKGKVLAIGNVDLKLQGGQSINLLDVFRLMEKQPVPHPEVTKEDACQYFATLIRNLDQTIAPTHLQKVVKWFHLISSEMGLKEMRNEEVDGLSIV